MRKAAVSILAPRRRGAQRCLDAFSEVHALFQSSPPVAGGRNQQRQRRFQSLRCFNPRPPSPGGATALAMVVNELQRRFNPRPPSPGGATPFCGSGASGCHCFNPRPPSPGGATVDARIEAAGDVVSILAPRRRGAQPPPCAFGTSPERFQSSPPVAGGRNRSYLTL